MKCLYAAVILALLGCFAGCASINPYKIAEKNVNNAKNLRVGMTKAEVLTIMGEPVKDESFNQPDVWYYYYDCNWLDGFITREECFPLVFKNGTLIGWGNRFYNHWHLQNKDRIPEVEVPPAENKLSMSLSSFLLMMELIASPSSSE